MDDNPENDISYWMPKLLIVSTQLLIQSIYELHDSQTSGKNLADSVETYKRDSKDFLKEEIFPKSRFRRRLYKKLQEPSLDTTTVLFRQIVGLKDTKNRAYMITAALLGLHYCNSHWDKHYTKGKAAHKSEIPGDSAEPTFWKNNVSKVLDRLDLPIIAGKEYYHSNIEFVQVLQEGDPPTRKGFLLNIFSMDPRVKVEDVGPETRKHSLTIQLKLCPQDLTIKVKILTPDNYKLLRWKEYKRPEVYPPKYLSLRDRTWEQVPEVVNLDYLC
ncbi:hypothetical protein H0H93_016014 [Arthromyces matolae]|nr:hypothetical protein H0H93_016014 [Arthromyces matolae]